MSDKIRAVRTDQELEAPLLPLYPNVIDIPLTAFLLHQDSKQHLSLELEEQTNAIIGSNDEIRTVLADGLARIAASSDEISAQLEELGISVQDMNNTLERISGQLDSIDQGITEVRQAVEAVGLAVRDLIYETRHQLNRLNEVALSIESLVRHPELTWAREQAVAAGRAFQVGDLIIADRCISQAAEGFGPHPGAATYVELLILGAEIAVRGGKYGLDKAANMIDRASLYLPLDPTSIHNARYDFVRGSYHLARFNLDPNSENLTIALNAFARAAEHETHHGIASIYRAVTRTSLKHDEAKIAAELATALCRNPKLAIEIGRLSPDKLGRLTVNIAIQLARDELYQRAGKTTYLSELLERVRLARQHAEAAGSANSIYRRKSNGLKDVEAHAYIMLRRLKRNIKSNSLMGAYIAFHSMERFRARASELVRGLES